MSKNKCTKCVNNYNNYSCSNDKNFRAEARIQFTIIENSDTICNLLTLIADENINIDAYLLQSLNDTCTLFTFVIGDDSSQPSTCLGLVRCILKKLCISFIESDVARVTFSEGMPGTLAEIYCALTEDLDIYSSYNGENSNVIYIETDCIDKAIKIINNLN